MADHDVIKNHVGKMRKKEKLIAMKLGTSFGYAPSLRFAKNFCIKQRLGMSADQAAF
ncbi:MAG: hypothetical protein ACYDBJ_12355 [Aggregatilineales bacterium]